MFFWISWIFFLIWINYVMKCTFLDFVSFIVNLFFYPIFLFFLITYISVFLVKFFNYSPTLNFFLRFFWLNWTFVNWSYCSDDFLVESFSFVDWSIIIWVDKKSILFFRDFNMKMVIGRRMRRGRGWWVIRNFWQKSRRKQFFDSSSLKCQWEIF